MIFLCKLVLMKKVILSYATCLFLIANIFGQESAVVSIKKKTLNWEATFKGALKKSKKENKPVLIYFTGSDWCGPCKVLDKKLFHSEKFKKLADKDLILYEADHPRNKDLVSPKKLEVNYDLKRKYKIRGFPTILFVNHKGKKIAYKKGLILTEYYYPFFQSVLENY